MLFYCVTKKVETKEALEIVNGGSFAPNTVETTDPKEISTKLLNSVDSYEKYKDSELYTIIFEMADSPEVKTTICKISYNNEEKKFESEVFNEFDNNSKLLNGIILCVYEYMKFTMLLPMRFNEIARLNGELDEIVKYNAKYSDMSYTEFSKYDSNVKNIISSITALGGMIENLLKDQAPKKLPAGRVFEI